MPCVSNQPSMKDYRFRKWLAIALTLTLWIGLLVPLTPERANANGKASALDQGAVGLAQAIKRLGVVASVLHTGAHPDDEDSGLLAYLARGRQARTAYLSLTRGDGGQNLIGPELYESLGVIRTDEMLAARKLDGAQQFFTRAYDFGFSKSREEALSKWDREAVLSDMVRVIRTFRPLVIVSQFSGTPRDGHGHHQAAGFLTPEAYRAAADPSRFPEQITEGLRAWKAKKLYVKIPARDQREGANAEQVTLSLNTGEFDPIFGRSYYEIALQGRSQHRSQDQGAIERRGPQYSRMKLHESSTAATAKEKDIFDGLDVTLTGIAVFAGDAAARLKPALVELQQSADEAWRAYNPFSPAAVAPIIARGLKRLGEIRAGLASMGLSESQLYETNFLLSLKENDFARALARAQGIVVDCLADDEIVTPGQTFGLNVTTYAEAGINAGEVALALPEGWTSIRQKEAKAVTDGRMISQTEFKVTVATDAEITQPYWLKKSRSGEMFQPGKGGTGIEPHAAPLITAAVEVESGGQKITVVEQAQYRYADKALGEVRRDLKVAAALSVNVTPSLVISPASQAATSREINVTLANNSKEGARGAVSLVLPQGWKSSPAKISFDLKREGEKTSAAFNVTVPPGAKDGRYELRAVAELGGKQFASGYEVIAYPHTEPRFVYRESSAVARVFDVKVAPGLVVGYLEGAGDDFANALKRIGVDVRLIEARELALSNLSRYDVIVTGVRVYETRPDVVANNARLLDYVKQGGTLIVQYNKGEYASGNFAPFAVKMKQTPDRVTDERASVVLLEPAHAAFNYPNKISERDFEGWVQERGTYFLSEWDPRFKSLMASKDQGEELQKGGVLVAEYGKGLYIYTGYAWFRQLPEGVPGAYRLVANLVSLPKARAGR